MSIRLLKDNPYGYRLDISEPEIHELYLRFKRWKKIPSWCPLSDGERFEFENYILKRKDDKIAVDRRREKNDDRP